MRCLVFRNHVEGATNDVADQHFLLRVKPVDMHWKVVRVGDLRVERRGLDVNLVGVNWKVRVHRKAVRHGDLRVATRKPQVETGAVPTVIAALAVPVSVVIVMPPVCGGILAHARSRRCCRCRVCIKKPLCGIQIDEDPAVPIHVGTIYLTVSVPLGFVPHSAISKVQSF